MKTKAGKQKASKRHAAATHDVAEIKWAVLLDQLAMIDGLIGFANCIYAGNQNDKSRYGGDCYQGPSGDGLSQRNSKLAVSFGFIGFRHNLLCCAFLLHLISVGFLSDNQANLVTSPTFLSS